jgi:hypothetical protein
MMLGEGIAFDDIVEVPGRVINACPLHPGTPVGVARSRSQQRGYVWCVACWQAARAASEPRVWMHVLTFDQALCLASVGFVDHLEATRNDP